ncbi:hydrolase [Acinetobacter nematophilus]|uniref:hydrolase n=1 Tax=Acinetobacter TaxID=469 RepID=UPI00258FB516|nr:hydrolase [Acinetobacter sp.]
MPITPLHLGLGASCKGIGNQHFSFLIFSGVQMLMDIEPLLGIILGWNTLHLYSHNLIGALLIGLFAIPIGKAMSEFCLYHLVKQIHWQITWRVAAFSALTGSFSHTLLDGLMHADMYPFYPFSQTQFLLNLIPYSYIFYGCLFGFILGGVLFLLHER